MLEIYNLVCICWSHLQGMMVELKVCACLLRSFQSCGLLLFLPFASVCVFWFILLCWTLFCLAFMIDCAVMGPDAFLFWV